MTKTAGKDSFSAPPGAYDLYVSGRSLGYTVPSAIADLIDNCIKAKAKNVKVIIDKSETDSFIAILDNGEGMSFDALKAAMALGRQPESERGEEDLGRFSMGLKTASLSMGKRYTVVTNMRRKPIVACFDLEHQKEHEWEILTRPFNDHEQSVLDRIASSNQDANTCLLITELDRAKKSISSLRFGLDKHLGMIFHRYIEDGKLEIKVSYSIDSDGRKVSPWDPFAAPNTSASPDGFVPEEGLLKGGGLLGVDIKGYLMPHRRELTDEQYSKLDGPKGWVAQQGFYVYRRDRMIIPGTWFNMREFKKEPAFQLARIKLDLPPELDSQWKIDIQKTQASPPQSAKAKLKTYGLEIRERSRRLFHSRGERTIDTERRQDDGYFPNTWEAKESNTGLRYKIKRDHQLCKMFTDMLNSKQKKAFNTLLDHIQQDVPVEKIWIDGQDKPYATSEDMELEDFGEAYAEAMAAFVMIAIGTDDKEYAKEVCMKEIRGIEQ